MSIAELLKARRNEILDIAMRHGAEEIRLFGSFARGDADAASDIDFLVRLRPGTTLLQRTAMIRELEGLLGRTGDVVSERGLRERVRDRVLREAVPV